MHAIKRPHAHLAPHLDVATRLDVQLDLQLIRIRIAAIHDLKDAARIGAVRHEHLGRVVLGLVLEINDGTADRVPRQRDDAVDESQFASRVAGGTDEEVLVAAAPVPEVEVVVVDFWVGGILELD